MNKPEALRLAAVAIFDRSIGWQADATAELRRLHAENEALRNVANRGGHIAVAMSRIDQLEARRDALLEALKMLVLATKEVSVGRYNEEAHDIALSKARAAIKAAEGEKNDPR